MKIKITDDYQTLWRIWGDDYAKEHLGKIYEADIEKDGWAHIDGAKFPPHAFTVLTAPTKFLFISPMGDGLFHNKVTGADTLLRNAGIPEKELGAVEAFIGEAGVGDYYSPEDRSFLVVIIK